MDVIHYAILDISKNIQVNLNIGGSKKFITTKVPTAEEGIRKTWEAVGNDLRWAMNEFDNQQENEKYEATK